MTEGPREPVPVAAPYAVAGASEGWYAVNQLEQQCEAQEMGPADYMALDDRAGTPYTMEDVTERGQVVQTTMHMLTKGVSVTWYRGKARCDQALRTKQQSQEQRREKYR